MGHKVEPGEGSLVLQAQLLSMSAFFAAAWPEFLIPSNQAMWDWELLSN
jgi:hypothetical protein